MIRRWANLHMNTSPEGNSKYYWQAVMAIGWGTAWSLSWILPTISHQEEVLLLLALSGFLGGVVAGYGQTRSLPRSVGWEVVAPLVWSLSWPILVFGTGLSLKIMSHGIQAFDIDYLTDLVFGGLLGAIPGLLAGVMVALPQSILLQQVRNQPTRRAGCMGTVLTMGRIVVSWGLAAFVATATGLVTQYSYPFLVSHALLDVVRWSIPGGLIGGLVFAMLSLRTVDWLVDAQSPKHQSRQLQL